MSGEPEKSKDSEARKIPDQSVSLSRIANLLALSLVGGQKQEIAVERLTAAGFTDREIASLIRTSPGVVAQVRYETNKARRQGPSGGSKRRKMVAGSENSDSE